MFSRRKGIIFSAQTHGEWRFCGEEKIVCVPESNGNPFLCSECGLIARAFAWTFENWPQKVDRKRVSFPRIVLGKLPLVNISHVDAERWSCLHISGSYDHVSISISRKCYRERKTRRYTDKSIKFRNRKVPSESAKYRYFLRWLGSSVLLFFASSNLDLDLFDQEQQALTEQNERQ